MSGLIYYEFHQLRGLIPSGDKQKFRENLTEINKKIHEIHSQLNPKELGLMNIINYKGPDSQSLQLRYFLDPNYDVLKNIHLDSDEFKPIIKDVSDFYYPLERPGWELERSVAEIYAIYDAKSSLALYSEIFAGYRVTIPSRELRVSINKISEGYGFVVETPIIQFAKEVASGVFTDKSPDKNTILVFCPVLKTLQELGIKYEFVCGTSRDAIFG